MTEADFIDYYQILQVHFDASAEVIQAAYKRLSRIYHPDSLSCDHKKMALLNDAYRILNDPQARNQYHRDWLRICTGRAQHVKATVKQAPLPPVSVVCSSQHAQTVMEDFFQALLAKSFHTAYHLLTEEDRERALPEDFVDWREAVNLCYQLEGYQLRFVRMYQDCRLDMVIYDHVAEFIVTVTETNLATMESSTDSIRKYAVYDGVSWKVWLGTQNIKSSILRFRMQAERNQNFDPMSAYHNAVSRIDTLTGLLSESGFFDAAQREVARSRRYKNPFSLLAFQLHCESREKETLCTCQFASIIKSCLRNTDYAARLNSNQIICLLTETRKYGADAAARKFLRIVSERQTEQYRITFGVYFYNGSTDIQEAVITACSMADYPPDTLGQQHI